MRKILALVLSLLMSVPASAQIVGTLPFTLQNGTVADANQVMADLNAIVSGVNLNAANAGANSNITALNGLTTPLVYTAGGSSTYIGGVSAGVANAQTVVTLTPTGFSLIAGKSVVFIAGFTNTAALTVNANGQGAKNVFVPQLNGAPASTVGGEVQAGQLVQMTYDGTEFVLINPSPTSQPSRSLVSSSGASVLDTDDHNRIRLGGGAFYQLTLGAPGAYKDPNFWVDVLNEDTARAKFISVSGGTSFYLYPGQIRRLMIDAGAVWLTWPSSQRWTHGGTAMFADITNGSDANDCLAAGSGSACQHICTAVNRQYNDIDHQNASPTVNVAAGTYTENCALAGQLTGVNVMFITGAGSGTTTWKPIGAGVPAFAQDGAELIINGFTFQNAGGSNGATAVAVHQTGILDLGNDIVFGSFPNGTYMLCDHGGGTINIPATLGINGSTGTVLQLGGGCSATWAGAGTLTITGGSTCSTFINMAGNANLAMGTVTVSGAENAGCQKYNVQINAALSAGGTSTTGWGGVAGNTATGGQFAP